MQLHQLKSKSSNKEKKRIGRGGKRGTYSGKGIKGQSSRAGRKLQPSIRLFIKRYPKKRGYRFNSFRPSPLTLNLKELEAKLDSNSTINPEFLLEKKLISKIKGRIPKVKILGKGRVTKKFVIENCEVSASVKTKIEKAGGKIK